MADQQHELSPAQLDFLAVLHAFGEPVSVDVVGLVAPLTPGALLDLIRLSTEAGWLVHTQDNFLFLNEKIPKDVSAEINNINTKDKIASVLEQLKKLDLLDQISPNIHNTLLEKAGHQY